MTPDEPLADALELMASHRISGIPIVEKSGTHTFVWTVSPKVPLGRARVDVVANLADKGRGYSGIPFHVASSCS